MIGQILVVDDESAVVDEILEALTDEGYMCASAASLEEMQAVIRANPRIRLVITDMRMRGGRSANLMTLARGASSHELEFIVISGYEASAAKLDHGASGVFEFLSKPLDVRILLSVVKRALIDAR